MPSTNRPFFANFFAAFRAQTPTLKAGPVSLTTSSAATNSSIACSTTASNPTSNARGISTKSTATSAAVTAAAQFHTSRSEWHPTSPVSYPRSSPSPGPSSPAAGTSWQQRSRTPSETRNASQPLTRRGSNTSDSSKGGMTDSLAVGDWYVGGRTASGEERFYKLGMVKKYNSEDRLSLDRLSL